MITINHHNTHTHTHTHIYICIYINIYTSINQSTKKTHTYLFVCLLVCVCLCVCLCICVCVCGLLIEYGISTLCCFFYAEINLTIMYVQTHIYFVYLFPKWLLLYTVKSFQVFRCYTNKFHLLYGFKYSYQIQIIS